MVPVAPEMRSIRVGLVRLHAHLMMHAATGRLAANTQVGFEAREPDMSPAMLTSGILLAVRTRTRAHRERGWGSPALYRPGAELP